jgi:hypothetical protein
MIDPEKVENSLKDGSGNYYSLEVSVENENVSLDDFLPAEPEYADAYRYDIISYREDTKMYESPIFEETSFAQAVIKRLKEIHGIKDPWDDDPDYFTRKLREKKIALEKSVNRNITDSEGNYYEISLKPEQKKITPEDFLPEDPRYPDESRYTIYKDDENIIIKDIELRDAVIKRLKKIHGITDDWDAIPDYFNKRYMQKILDEKEGN